MTDSIHRPEGGRHRGNTIAGTRLMVSAQRLHAYLSAAHTDGGALVGPDSGVRFNYRVGRFVKGYLAFLPWRDRYYYLQAQAYWILANWLLLDLSSHTAHREDALAASDVVLARQRADGAWDYPNPAWQGRVATAEGTWAAIALLETFRRTADDRYLRAVRRWRTFLDREIGFVDLGGASAANYFAGRADSLVPNNSAFVARFLAELWAVDGEDQLPARCRSLVAFLRQTQLPSGELPYAVAAPGATSGDQTHFQCFQYNAFQLLDLLRCHELAPDGAAADVIRGVSAFVATAPRPDGAARYDCRSRSRRTVTYHTAAVAAALSQATARGFGDHERTATTAYRQLLARQQPDGSFPFSRGEWLILRDRRSYPRNLAMILLHVLLGAPAPGAGPG